jgi:activating signal cointegrator 1
MKALTICQPYAELICRGIKRVENRTWATPHRGPVAIHAGKSRKFLDLTDDGTLDAEYDIAVAEMPFGAVVAVADLVDCVWLDSSKPIWKHVPAFSAEKFPWMNMHEHTEGPCCWVLENVRCLPEPVPWMGLMGLWELPDSAIVIPQVVTAN